jgi:type IV pilus assembly protein PilA
MKKVVKNNKGFSLVELIVVIAIMAVLVGVLAPQFMGYVEKSREATDIQNLDSIRTQVEAWVADHENIATVTIKMDGSGTTATPDSGSATSSDIINTSTSTKIKANRWLGLTAVFTTATNTWAYTIDSPSGTEFYAVDSTTGEIAVK